jgi:hypothetical protein
MSKLANWFSAEKPHEPWPLRFDRYSFGARCYNTLRCSILFKNYQFSLHEVEPSGQPYALDWKDHWEASFIVMDRMDVPMPPVDVDWTALDGVERSAVIELDEIFRDRRILHNVARENVDEYWAVHGIAGRGHDADIFLEVNDCTINVYVKAHVYTKPHPSSPDTRGMVDDLMLAWTRTY